MIPTCSDSSSFSIAFNRRDSYFPRVSISGIYDLREIFKGLGVTDAFINRADLSGTAEKLIALKMVICGSDVTAGLNLA